MHLSFHFRIAFALVSILAYLAEIHEVNDRTHLTLRCSTDAGTLYK